MKRVRRLRSWIERIPVWVWLFIFVGQVLTITSRLRGLPIVGQLIDSFSNDPSLATGKADLEAAQYQMRCDIVEAILVGIVALGLAFWKWSISNHGEFRFTVRALLIATTLVAVGLALIVWMR